MSFAPSLSLPFIAVHTKPLAIQSKPQHPVYLTTTAITPPSPLDLNAGVHNNYGSGATSVAVLSVRLCRRKAADVDSLRVHLQLVYRSCRVGAVSCKRWLCAQDSWQCTPVQTCGCAQDSRQCTPVQTYGCAQDSWQYTPVQTCGYVHRTVGSAHLYRHVDMCTGQ